jgi:hypothetical protein
MATLLLSTVGSALGTATGGPVGSAIGRVLGAVAGSLIDQSLLSSSDSPRFVQGPRLKELDGLASTEGAAIPRVYGRARVGGQLIWATRFEEVANTTVERTGARPAARAVGAGRRRSALPTAISPISRSGSAKARSASCGGSGWTGASSTSPQ